MKYTSLELSKKLNDAGFKGESEMYWVQEDNENDEWKLMKYDGKIIWYDCVQLFDILNDLCVKYAKELFGEEETIAMVGDEIETFGHITASQKIISLIQQGKKEEAEKYLYDNCVFNKQ